MRGGGGRGKRRGEGWGSGARNGAPVKSKRAELELRSGLNSTEFPFQLRSQVLSRVGENPGDEIVPFSQHHTLLILLSDPQTCSNSTLLTCILFSCFAICLARNVNRDPTWLGCLEKRMKYIVKKLYRVRTKNCNHSLRTFQGPH